MNMYSMISTENRIARRELSQLTDEEAIRQWRIKYCGPSSKIEKARLRLKRQQKETRDWSFDNGACAWFFDYDLHFQFVFTREINELHNVALHTANMFDIYGEGDEEYKG